MIKRSIICLTLVLFIFFSFSFVLAEDPELIRDSLDRVIKENYNNDSQDVVYEYYYSTNNVHYIRVGGNLEGYEYDERGNLLSEKYFWNPENNRYYLYYDDDNFEQISGGGSKIIFEYSSDGNFKSASVVKDGKKFVVLYKYNDLFYLVGIIGLKSETTREYVDGLEVKEEILTKIKGNEYQTLESIEYEYDNNRNKIKAIDGVGVEFEYIYEDIEFACIKYDEISNSSFESVCNNSELVIKKINNYEINYTGNDEFEKYRGNTWDTEYTPIYEYDGEGYLTRFDDIYYNYSSDYSFLSGINVKDVYEEDLDISFRHSDSGLLESSIYSSEFGDFSEGYSYDPLGRIIKKSINGVDVGGGFTGNSIKNLFTGFGIFDSGDSSGFNVYYSIPGDEYSVIGEEEYLELIKSENLWPELAEYYVGAIDEEGNLNESWITSSCFNSDVGENETLLRGYVEYKDQIMQDYCLDENMVVENYCGRVLRWDFWILEPKTFQQVCQYGCEMGRCLTAEEVAPGEPVELDLPDEPPVLG
jgi:hypothetical protein